MTPPQAGEAQQYNRHCPIARTTELISDSWTPLLLRELMVGRNRFAEMQASLDISKGVLTQRLRTLEENGVIERIEYQDNPPRSAYHLTDKGWALWDVLLAMWGFGDEWLFRDGAGLELVHATSKERIDPMVIDRNSGEEIDLQTVRLRMRQR